MKKKVLTSIVIFSVISGLLTLSASANEHVVLNYKESQQLLSELIKHSPEDVTPAFPQVPREGVTPPLNYVNQPPVVPHTTRGYQVTKNFNRCLTCHSPENSKITGAKTMTPTHYINRDGTMRDDMSPRRYFCLQCHVTQAEVDGIIENKFHAVAEERLNQHNHH